MLGCVTVFGLLLGGICGCGLGLGLLLHWLVPAIDRGMATLCGLVATGIALLAFGQLMTLAEPLEAEEEPPPVWRLGVDVQSVRKVTISTVFKIKRLQRINSFTAIKSNTFCSLGSFPFFCYPERQATTRLIHSA